MDQKTKVAIIHPGEMGASVAACIKQSGHEVCWASHTRSPASVARADEQGLIDKGNMGSLLSDCEVVVSVCPPNAAESVAEQVIHTGFCGTYLDANAISPLRSEAIARHVTDKGIHFIDGGIVGPPAWEEGTTWLHLSGPNAEAIRHLFSTGPLQINIVGDKYGLASALKICFAAYTKGRSALLLDILALSEHYQIREQLEHQWQAFWPEHDFVAATRKTIQNALPKAWRFSGEMAEIADTFDSAGLPDGIHRSAEVLFKSLDKYKNTTDVHDIDKVLNDLLK